MYISEISQVLESIGFKIDGPIEELNKNSIYKGLPVSFIFICDRADQLKSTLQINMNGVALFTERPWRYFSTAQKVIVNLPLKKTTPIWGLYCFDKNNFPGIGTYKDYIISKDNVSFTFTSKNIDNLRIYPICHNTISKL